MKISDLPMPLLCINSSGGTDGHGTLQSVNLITGVRNVVSDFGNPNQGPRTNNPTAGTWLPANVLKKIPESVLITTANGGTGNKPTLSLVHPETGQRRILSDWGNPTQGTSARLPISAVTLPAIAGARDNGAALVLAYANDDDPDDMILSINALGHRSLLTDLGHDALQGQWKPTAMTYLPASTEDPDSLVVAGMYLEEDNSAVLVFVDPDDGSISPLSYFANPDQGWNPPPTGDNYVPAVLSLTVSSEPAVYALVSKITAPNSPDTPEPYGFIIRVDPSTGQRQVVSNLTDRTQGPLSTKPTALTWLPYDPNSLALCDRVTGVDQGGAIFLVNPSTGERTPLSNLGHEHQGPAGVNPSGLLMTQ